MMKWQLNARCALYSNLSFGPCQPSSREWYQFRRQSNETGSIFFTHQAKSEHQRSLPRFRDTVPHHPILPLQQSDCLVGSAAPLHSNMSHVAFPKLCNAEFPVDRFPPENVVFCGGLSQSAWVDNRLPSGGFG